MQRIGLRFLFPDLSDAGKPRPAFERSSQLGKLRRRAHGQDFDPAIEKIPRVSDDLQFFRRSLHKEPEPHSLHGPGGKIAPGLFLVAHKLRNCSRDLHSSAEDATCFVLSLS